MVKSRVEKEIIDIAKKYIDEVKNHYCVDDAYLFGSYAQGTQHEDSDIDIAIISKDIKDKHAVLLELMRLRRKIDTRIEPHPIRPKDRPSSPLYHEIELTGIRLV